MNVSDEQIAIHDMATRFGEEHVKPHAIDWERAGTIPRAFWSEAARLGLGGLQVTESLGGAGLAHMDATLVFEGIARSCPSVAAFLSIHNLCVNMIERHGHEGLRERFLAPAIAMQCICSYCLTEPGSGSDAAALRTRARRSGPDWVLSGTKSFVSGGGYSDAYIVMCRTGGHDHDGISAVLVENGTRGMTFGGLEDKMGWKAQPTRQVHLNDCRVPEGNLVGEKGKGFRYAMAALDGGRLNIAACSIGGAQAAFDATLAYMQEREAFGKRLAEFQALQFRLADLATELRAARLLLHDAAGSLDSALPDARARCAMAKRYCTDAGFRIANECLQLHGGYGVLAETGIEKIVRDLRVHQIIEGSNEIMRAIIARQLVGRD